MGPHENLGFRLLELRRRRAAVISNPPTAAFTFDSRADAPTAAFTFDSE